VIRELDHDTGNLRVIAGNPPPFNDTSPTFLNCDFGGDGGPASQAFLFQPYGMYLDPGSGGLYFTDNVNDRVRVITAGASAQVPESPLAPLLLMAGLGSAAAVSRRRGWMPARVHGAGRSRRRR